MPNQEQYHDLENGDPTRQIEPIDGLDDRNFDEYSALVRYISTYRDPRKERAEGDEDENEAPKNMWYAPWRRWTKRKESGKVFAVPDEWVTTDLKTGLSSAEADKRRSKTGFNEITTESENLFVKFIGYFRGPILYGITSPLPIR
jgi:H+-transporting ATPase